MVLSVVYYSDYSGLFMSQLNRESTELYSWKMCVRRRKGNQKIRKKCKYEKEQHTTFLNTWNKFMTYYLNRIEGGFGLDSIFSYNTYRTQWMEKCETKENIQAQRVSVTIILTILLILWKATPNNWGFVYYSSEA